MSGPDQTPHKPDDRELEDFLAGRGKVRETYHAGAQEQSPAVVDDAILQMAAKAAVESETVAARKPRTSRRWQPSLAAAAVLVLAFGMFFQVKQDPVAERAAFTPSADALSQKIAVVQAVAPAPAPSALSEVKQKKAFAGAEQTQREKPELKKEMAAASGAIAMPEPPPPAMAAMAAPAADMAFKREAEADSRNIALQDASPAKPAAPAAMMSAKTLRSASVAESVAPTAAASISDTQIDHWLQTCSADPAMIAIGRNDAGTFLTPQQWHGLSVTGLADGALLFAPTATREKILGQLGGRDQAPTVCLKEAQNPQGWKLLCGCPKP